MEQPGKIKENIKGLCRDTPVGDTRSSTWEDCDIPVYLAFCPCFLILPPLLFPTLLPSNIPLYKDIWDPAHILKNSHPLFVSQELLIHFFPSRSSQFSVQPRLLLTLWVAFRVRLLLPTAFHTSSLAPHRFTNLAPDWPAGPSLFVETQPCVLQTSAARVLLIVQLSLLFLYELHCICLTFSLTTLCNNFERTKPFSLKRKSSIDSTDSEDSYTTFPSVQMKWSQISASLKTKACKYTIILCFAILYGLH